MAHNALTDDEAERLAMLSEEAGELALEAGDIASAAGRVVQAIGKVLRNGYAGVNPLDRAALNNRRNLEKELGQLIGIADAMVVQGDLDGANIEAARATKWEKARPYTFHQDDSEGGR